MPRRPSGPVEEASPLRRARLARNWTLEEVAEEIDLRTPGGHSGVTPSMVSGWELGRHTTSIGHRKTLCEIYDQPPGYAVRSPGPRAGGWCCAAPGGRVRGFAGCDAGDGDRGAAVPGGDGSRSRDARYLAAIEDALARRPGLVCYRVLFGPPRHQVLKDHLARLLELRDPADRSLGVKTLNIGLVEDTDSSPERFFCASEQMAVVPIPSLTSHEAFDSGVVFGPAAAARLVDHGRQAYAAARRIETLTQIHDLRVIHDGGALA